MVEVLAEALEDFRAEFHKVLASALQLERAEVGEVDGKDDCTGGCDSLFLSKEVEHAAEAGECAQTDGGGVRLSLHEVSGKAETVTDVEQQRS